MPVAVIDGIETYYETHGEGPPLLTESGWWKVPKR